MFIHIVVVNLYLFDILVMFAAAYVEWRWGYKSNQRVKWSSA